MGSIDRTRIPVVWYRCCETFSFYFNKRSLHFKVTLIRPNVLIKLQLKPKNPAFSLFVVINLH